MGTYVSDFFDRVYVMIKLSLMFWVMTLMGGVVLGVGPAFLGIAQLYQEYGWSHRDMSWREIGNLFVGKFKRGNALLFIYACIVGVLLYNLYLSTQIQGIAILFLQFLIATVIVFTIGSYFYAVLIDNNFDIELINLLKLSVISVMGNFFTLIKLMVVLIFVSFVTSRYMGLLPFLTWGMLVVALSWVGKPLIAALDEHLG